MMQWVLMRGVLGGFPAAISTATATVTTPHQSRGSVVGVALRTLALLFTPTSTAAWGRVMVEVLQ